MLQFRTPEPARFEERRILTLFFLLSFIIRLIYALSHPTLPTVVDAADFDVIAYNLSVGNGFGYGPGELTSWRAPGYVFFLAGIYRYFGHNYWPVWFFESLVGALLPVCIYLIAKSLFSVQVGMFCAFICAIHPKLVMNVNAGLTENLFSTITAVLIYSLITLTGTSRILPYFLTGLVIGFNLLCKIVLLPFVVLLVPLSLFLNPETRPGARRYAITVFAALVILAPWTMRNYLVHHHFVLVNTNGGFTLWYNNNNLSESGYFWGATAKNDRQKEIDRQIREREELITSPESLREVMTPIVRSHYWNVLKNVGTPELRQEFQGLSEVEADRLFTKKALTHILTHKARFVKKSVRSALKFFNVFDEGAQYQWLWGILFPFSILGLVYTSKNWRNYLLLYGLLFNILVVSTIFESSVRYRIPFEPYFYLFGVHGLIELYKKKPRSFVICLTAVCCMNLPGIFYPEKTRMVIRSVFTFLGFQVIPW